MFKYMVPKILCTFKAYIMSTVECKRVASAFWRFFRRSVFLFYNEMYIGSNWNLILNDWKVIGSYLKPLTICSKVYKNDKLTNINAISACRNFRSMQEYRKCHLWLSCNNRCENVWMQEGRKYKCYFQL